MSELKLHIAKFIATRELLSQKDKLLIAVSGGVDSMVLLHVLQSLEYEMEVAHCNFKLRGEESDKDERLVKEYAHTLGIPCHIKSFNTEEHASLKGISIQMAARELRYSWFQELKRQQGFHKIATAHHQDDNVETVFLNLIRGTGISGLTGMKPLAENGVVRPMLNVSKKDIEEYAAQLEVPYRTDQSNFEDKYKRNLLRNQIIPLIKELNPNVENTLGVEMRKYEELERLLKKEVDSFDNGQNEKINLDELRKSPCPHLVLFELLKDTGFTFSQVEDILEGYKQGQSGIRFIAAGHIALLDRGVLHIQNKNYEQGVDEVHQIQAGEANFTGQEFELEITPVEVDEVVYDSDPSCIYLDLNKLSFPLKIRKWKQGDRFCPLGMSGKSMKVSDFLVNNKVSVFEKEKVYVLLSGEKVAWVINHRVAEDFKISKNTTRALKFDWKKNDC